MDEDFLTPMATSASMIHELYESFVAAGFTPEQAMELTIAVIVETMNGSKRRES